MGRVLAQSSRTASVVGSKPLLMCTALAVAACRGQAADAVYGTRDMNKRYDGASCGKAVHGPCALRLQPCSSRVCEGGC